MNDDLFQIAWWGRLARLYNEREMPLERAESHAKAMELRDKHKGTPMEQQAHDAFWEAYCNAQVADYLQMRIAKKNVFGKARP